MYVVLCIYAMVYVYARVDCVYVVVLYIALVVVMQRCVVTLCCVRWELFVHNTCCVFVNVVRVCRVVCVCSDVCIWCLMRVCRVLFVCGCFVCVFVVCLPYIYYVCMERCVCMHYIVVCCRACI